MKRSSFTIGAMAAALMMSLAPQSASAETAEELMKSRLGTTDADPVIVEAINRAAQPVTEEQQAKALECWNNNSCETGTGGEISVAYADGFGENVWRQVTHMELILQALTYPEIGRIIYTSAQFDTQKAISDFRSLIAQEVDIIIGFPDAGDAMLPSVREATERGIIYVPHSYGRLGEPGEDYLTYVAEDVCALGERFAAVLNEEIGEGKVAFKSVTVGPRIDSLWVIEDGVAAGEQVIVEGLQRVQDGMMVAAKPAPAAPAQGGN